MATRNSNMLSAAATTQPTDGPLTAQHLRELADAKARTNIIRKAARVAACNGWTIGAFAALSLPFAWSSASGMLMTAGLGLVAYLEFRGRRGLLAFNPAAATLLGWNQVGLLALLVIYCGWMISTATSDVGAMTAQLGNSSDLTDLLGSTGDVETMLRPLVVAFYGTVMAGSVVVQGLNAYYYFTRRKHVEAIVKETPAWALELQR